METLTEAMARVKEAASLQALCEERLERRGRDNYVCPFCGSGNGPKRTAAFKVQKERFKCFSASCGRGGDVFDLMGGLIGSEDKAEQLEAVAAWAGVDGWRRGSTDLGSNRQEAASTQEAHGEKVEQPSKDPKAEQYEQGRQREREYVQAMRANVHDTEAVAYLASRGITEEEAVAWGIGYDPSRKRIVIPWKGSDYYHIDRSTTMAGGDGKYLKPKSADVGQQPLWNPSAITKDVLFVVEGALDALAVEACGYEAVALGSAGGRSLVEAMSGVRRSNRAMAVLMLDQDGPGVAGSEKLRGQMDNAGIDYIEFAGSFPSNAKDAAEGFANDREELASILKACYATAMEQRDAQREEAYAAALKRLSIVDAAEIADGICMFADPVDPIPTGFPQMDKVFNGGLQPKSVYVLGGGTSMGKTTLVHQIADGIAARGDAHVVFVSVEQRASELIAKSLSRILSTVPDGDGKVHLVTAQDLTIKNRRMAFNESLENQLALAQAQVYYRDNIAPRLHYMEAQSQPNVADIRTIVETVADKEGKPPILIVDYLQLLGPMPGHERDDEKGLLKRNMVALRQLAGDYNTPVIALAALSRDGSHKNMETDSFRDSSNIEYSSDVLMGIQLRNFSKRLENTQENKRKYLAAQWMAEEKDKDLRELEIVVLKNRAGQIVSGECGGLKVWFSAPYNFFSEEAPKGIMGR